MHYEYYTIQEQFLNFYKIKKDILLLSPPLSQCFSIFQLWLESDISYFIIAMYNYVETFIFVKNFYSTVKRQLYLSIVRVCGKFIFRSNILPAFYSNYFLKVIFLSQ